MSLQELDNHHIIVCLAIGHVYHGIGFSLGKMQLSICSKQFTIKIAFAEKSFVLLARGLQWGLWITKPPFMIHKGICGS